MVNPVKLDLSVREDVHEALWKRLGAGMKGGVLLFRPLGKPSKAVVLVERGPNMQSATHACADRMGWVEFRRIWFL